MESTVLSTASTVTTMGDNKT